MSPCSWAGFTLLSLPCFGHTPHYCSAKAQRAGQIKGTSADKPCLSWCVSHTYLSFSSANIINHGFRSLARILFLLLLQKVKCFADIAYRGKPWTFTSRATKNFEENVRSNPTLQCLPSRHKQKHNSCLLNKSSSLVTPSLNSSVCLPHWILNVDITFGSGITRIAEYHWIMSLHLTANIFIHINFPVLDFPFFERSWMWVIFQVKYLGLAVILGENIICNIISSCLKSHEILRLSLYHTVNNSNYKVNQGF